MINIDYRNSKFYECDYSHILADKEKFLQEFIERHPAANSEKIYTYVNRRLSHDNKAFREIYFKKCAYCGVPMSLYNYSNYQIDHFVAQANVETHTNIGIHNVRNLVFSCEPCNQSKKALDYSTSEDAEILHPDNNKLPEIYRRDDDFKIIISEEYRENETVTEFYEKLKLGSQSKRVAYVIMAVNDFVQKYPENPASAELKIRLDIIREKWNEGEFVD